MSRRGSLSSLFLSSEEENLTGCDCGATKGSILIQVCNSCGWMQLSTIESSLLHQTLQQLKKYQQSSVSTSPSGQFAEGQYLLIQQDLQRAKERLMKLQQELGHCDKLCFIKQKATPNFSSPQNYNSANIDSPSHLWKPVWLSAMEHI